MVQGSNLHLASFWPGANILTLSKGENEAGEELDYARFMHSQLPEFLRLKVGKDQSSLITYPAMHSRMRALPATEDAGVGFGGATRVVLDEWEYHPYAEQNFAEIMPMLSAGGQLIIMSTADKLKTNTKFKEMYRQARAGENNFYPIFLPYDVVPYRTEEWYEAQRKDYAQWEIECKLPRNEQEALETLKTRRFFDSVVLETMYVDCLNPVEHELSEKYRGLVKIYRLPVVGKRYCVFTDPSYGRDDPHATIVMEAITGEQVAESHGKASADQCALIHDELVRLYGNAFNCFELNAEVGNVMRDKLSELKTPNQAPMIKPDGTTNKDKVGWWTSKTLKDKMLWGLEEAVRLRQIIPHNRAILDEFAQFMLPEGEAPQAPRGAHDDYIMAWAGVWQIRKYIRTGNMRVTSWKYQ